jgi:probable F420-dependent oxidoreductase
VFRFGYQMNEGTADALITAARAAEAAGFDVVHTSDHVGTGFAPLAPLAAVAAATERVRVCPLVLNNDFHHPVHLAREIAAFDNLTGGRVELGLGAGHSFTEYDSIGVPFDPPAVRKARMAEAVEIVRRLLDGEEVSFEGEHYRLHGVRTMRSHQEHLPILVGVNGRAPLAHAARHADTVGITMLGRTLADGQRHDTRWEADRLDRTVAFVDDQARGRTSPLEKHVLVQAVVVTDDREGAASRFVERGIVPTLADALATPFLAIGTHDEIVAHLRACRERWGISYFTVRDVDAFAPVIERVRRG